MRRIDNRHVGDYRIANEHGLDRRLERNDMHLIERNLETVRHRDRTYEQPTKAGHSDKRRLRREMAAKDHRETPKTLHCSRYALPVKEA